MAVSGVEYTCPTCGKFARVTGAPIKCGICGKIICNKCSKFHFCPECMPLLSEKHKKQLKNNMRLPNFFDLIEKSHY